MSTVEVRCNCGAVTVRLSAPPLQQFYCHCDDCQAATGGPYVMAAVYPAQAVAVDGATEPWTLKTMPRRRCRVCGTQMLAEVPGGELIGVKADRLPAGLFRPRFHIQCRHAHLPVRDELPHYAGFPPEFGGSDERVAW